MDDLPDEITCAICSYQAPLDKQYMAYKCVVCGTEVWTDERKLLEYRKAERAKAREPDERKRFLSRVNRQITKEVLPIYPVPSGGGGSKSAGRKKPKKKKPVAEPWKI